MAAVRRPRSGALCIIFGWHCRSGSAEDRSPAAKCGRSSTRSTASPGRSSAAEGVEDEARRPRPDLELVFSGSGGGRARLVQRGTARCRSGAGLSGRPSLSRTARRHGRFRRRLSPFGAGRLSRMGRRQAALCAGTGHVLVSRHARRSRRPARRCRHRSRAPHRRGTLGRDGAAPAADRGRNRPGARPGNDRPGAGVITFGLTAAKALEDGTIDGFWANGMGTEVAVRRGVGIVVLDVRRGDGPKPCFNYTMSSLAATDRLIERAPDTAAAAIRAIVKTQAALKEDVSCATQVGRKLFPPQEAELIAELIRRDLPYYDPSISPGSVAGMNQFARDIGILRGEIPYEKVVAPNWPRSGKAEGL